MKLEINIFKNTSIHFLGKIISLLINIGFFAIAARYLGQVGFGKFTIVMAYLQTFSIFADWGLYMIFVQMLSIGKYSKSYLMSNFFTLRIIISILILGVGILISFLIPQYGDLIELGIAITAISFIFSSLVQLFTGFFQYKMKMGKVALAESLGKAALFGFVLLASQFDLGILFILTGVIIGSLVSFLILFFSIKKYINIKFAFNIELYKKVFQKTWPVGVSIILTTVYFKGDTIILSLFRPASEVGIYGAAYRVLEVLIMFPPIFMGLVLPHMSRMLAKKALKKFKSIFQKSFDFFIALIIPLVVGTWYLADKIMVFVAGESFSAAGGPLKILIIATALIFLSSLGSYTIIALEKQKKMLKFYGLAVFLGISGYIALVPKFTYWGAAIVTVLVEAVVTIGALIVIWKETKINLDFKVLKKSLLATLIMAIIGILIKDFHVILMAFLFILVYFGSLFILGGISKDFIKKLKFK